MIDGGDSLERSSSSPLEQHYRIFQTWRIIFGVSCVIAVSLDPLFFYVPVIDEENKCIELDKKLRTISLILRSVTDIIGIINIILQVLNGYTEKTSGEDKKIPRLWPYFLIDILGLLPFPQVLGAFWYFLSIERETACWHRACVDKECSESSFNCDHSSGNYTFLNHICIISPPYTTPNATIFDFGIFHEALQYGVVQSKSFSEKFFHCFWWGLRNLSSFGQNLQTSNYVWENLFTILISLFGLLLFSYFIGNLQEEEERMEMEEKTEMEEKKRTIEIWMFKYRLPVEMKNEIMQNVDRRLERKKDVFVENLLRHLPEELRKATKRYLCFDILKTTELRITFSLSKGKRLKQYCDTKKGKEDKKKLVYIM
ncbi:hypothetical protein SO802_024428 [Lithocarpus litseifolius]|uniref:Uncharacterized protein n=1 Tax=Lithocarpus litseifolius TaxID=425828 RepID=A0AAW2CEC6_9ROSI